MDETENHEHEEHTHSGDIEFYIPPWVGWTIASFSAAVIGLFAWDWYQGYREKRVQALADMAVKEAEFVKVTNHSGVNVWARTPRLHENLRHRKDDEPVEESEAVQTDDTTETNEDKVL